MAESQAARADLDRRLAELAEAEQQVAALRQTYELALAQLVSHARELQLAAWLDDLEAYRETLRSYENAAEGWLRGHREAWSAGRRAAEAETRFAEAARRREEAGQRAEVANERARRAWAEYETLESTVGAEVKDVLARKEREVARRTALDERVKQLRREAQEAGETLARLSERYALKQAELDDRYLERDRAVFGLQRLGTMELLPLVTERLPTEPPKDWTLTRSLELARALEQELAQVDLGDNARNRRAERLHAGYNQLLSDLGQEFQPNLSTEDDVWIVRMMRDSSPLDPRQLLALLADEKAQRANLLAKEEREVLLKFLLGEIGDHLRQRLRQARELVEGMNRELKDCATASGMTLKLDWRPEDSHDGAPSREIVPLLARGAEMLSEAERAQLQSFFHTRIVAAREQWQAVPWREHLLKTLDYRRWHSFRLKRKEPGKNDWSELTQKSHAASSGGEKAVALHLPLFAAAAAHYQSADPASPRLILLDEAFVGIDEGMKGRLMALLVRFDLDFLMTSHNEWGCYQELPGVATYHLMRDPRERGVLATRFVWNGERLSEDHWANNAENP